MEFSICCSNKKMLRVSLLFEMLYLLQNSNKLRHKHNGINSFQRWTCVLRMWKHQTNVVKTTSKIQLIRNKVVWIYFSVVEPFRFGGAKGNQNLFGLKCARIKVCNRSIIGHHLDFFPWAFRHTALNRLPSKFWW